MNTIGDFHLAGHSLGAHICGYAAKWLKTRTTGKLPRISALDPAGPMFQFLDDPALNVCLLHLSRFGNFYRKFESGKRTRKSSKYSIQMLEISELMKFSNLWKNAKIKKTLVCTRNLK